MFTDLDHIRPRVFSKLENEERKAPNQSEQRIKERDEELRKNNQVGGESKREIQSGYSKVNQEVQNGLPTFPTRPHPYIPPGYSGHVPLKNELNVGKTDFDVTHHSIEFGKASRRIPTSFMEVDPLLPKISNDVFNGRQKLKKPGYTERIQDWFGSGDSHDDCDAKATAKLWENALLGPGPDMKSYTISEKRNGLSECPCGIRDFGDSQRYVHGYTGHVPKRSSRYGKTEYKNYRDSIEEFQLQDYINRNLRSDGSYYEYKADEEVDCYRQLPELCLKLEENVQKNCSKKTRWEIPDKRMLVSGLSEIRYQTKRIKEEGFYRGGKHNKMHNFDSAADLYKAIDNFEERHGCQEKSPIKKSTISKAYSLLANHEPYRYNGPSIIRRNLEAAKLAPPGKPLPSENILNDLHRLGTHLPQYMACKPSRFLTHIQFHSKPRYGNGFWKWNMKRTHQAFATVGDTRTLCFDP